MGSVKSRLNFRRLALSLSTLVCALGAGVGAYRAVGAQSAAPTSPPPVAATDLARQFEGSFRPFLNAYCIDCHSGDAPAADLNLDAKSLAAMQAHSTKLLKITARVANRQMPPATFDKQPPLAERSAAVAWLKGLTAEEIRAHAGDPGVVLAHRLSNSEYNYTIKDLTGVDIQPAREFPVDPANQAGFANSGESLMMDTELLKKYMDAARLVSDYMVFQSDGIAFAPHLAIVDTDRDKYAVNRILEFYKRQPTSLAAYLLAAWHFEQQKSTGITLEALAAKENVSPKYLKTVHQLLTNTKEKIGPAAALSAWWRDIKDAGTPEAQQAFAANLADWVHALRAATRPTFPNQQIGGMDIGSQPLVIWKVRKIEASRYSYAPGSALKLAPALYIEETSGGPAMEAPPATEAADYEKSFEAFAKIFPDEYLVTERAPVYLNPNSGEGKLKGHFLNAGLHNQTGYFRDDRPLCDLILSDKDKAELDRLWTDFNLITNAPLRQFQSMIWFERTDSKYMAQADFNFVRAEDDDLGQEPKFSRLRDVFIKDLNPRASAQAKTAVAEYFDFMQALFKKTDADRTQAQARQVDSIIQFAARAYRRPLSAAEQQDLRTFYKKLRTDGALDHEEAMRDVLASILMSPHFCYRFVAPPSQNAAVALTDYELASRLSYFLWSSMPDPELLNHAAKGDLHDPVILRAQARRMLKDDRITHFATEFGGNWLDFRQFESFNGVDRSRFTTFDNTLRESMFQEPIHFLTHILQDDTSVLDLLFADYTYVNAPLAKHYGMPVSIKGDDWVRVDGASAYQRGGMLPMAVFLTQNSPGLRTSPVKRGYWVVKRVLGEEIPAPPPNVPALPPDESKMDLPLPEALARHRSDENCATCHVRFDAMGLVFEGFGPTGQTRTLDMAGKPVQNTAKFPTGESGTGLSGLRTYVKQRQDDFLDNLCRKLLSNALERSLLLSDEPLIAQMRQNLQQQNYKFTALVDTVIFSPQFLTKRHATANTPGARP